MDANVTPFILKDGKRLITLTTLHFGPEEKIIAKIDNKESFSFTMPDGIKTFDIPVTLSQTGGNIQLTVTSGKRTSAQDYTGRHYCSTDFIFHSSFSY